MNLIELLKTQVELKKNELIKSDFYHNTLKCLSEKSGKLSKFLIKTSIFLEEYEKHIEKK